MSASSPPSSPGIPLPAHLRNIQTSSNQRGKWKGEEMEMQHFRDFHSLKQNETQNQRDQKHHHTAVDISQFQNTIVGQGYQAKHVVRQKSVSGDSSAALKILDMSQPTANTTKRVRSNEENDEHDERKKREKDHNKKEKKKKHRHQNNHSDNTETIDLSNELSHVQKYLKCDALRDFRREMEYILRTRR